MHFPSVSDSPLFSTNFSDSGKDFSQFHLFAIRKISDDLFFKSPTTNLEFPPISPVSLYFPLFRENYYSSLPTFTNYPPVFEKLTCFFTYFMCISFPPYSD